jgi:hypothetical protein
MANITDSLYASWEKRNPKFEKDFENSVLRVISDYGKGASANNEIRGKILGGGYEPYILAFFIGLYSDKRKKIKAESKVLGQPIQYWGNLDSKKGRNAYSSIRPFIFTALVAKSDIDLIALDKGELPLAEAVTILIETMEEYANYGFHLMEEKLKDNPGYFFNQNSFLDIFMKLSFKKQDDFDDDAPESLD